LRFDIVFEQASFIEESISGVTREGGLGAIFAVIIILLFLSGYVGGRYRLSWRSTIVTAVSIPLSVFMAFALLRWLPSLTEVLFVPLANLTSGIPVLGVAVTALHRLFPLDVTLNIMTLSGMTVAIGRVVDDSIVVLENIYRHIQRGDDMRESVLMGTRDVAIAIFASTVTTVIVFLPIGLLGGLIGEFFLPFGVAVTFALASSFLVAVTIVPLLAHMFIRKENLPEERETSLQKKYTPVLEWALNHRALSLAVAALVFVGSMFLLADRPQAFLPDFGELQISVTVDLPAGTTMADTDHLVMDFETNLETVDGLGVVQVGVGSAGGFESIFFGGGVDQSAASIQMGVEDTAQADILTAEVRQAAEDVFGEDNVIVSIGSLSSGAFGGFGLILSGDPEDLAAVNDEVIAALNEVEGLANVSSNLADSDTILRVDGEPAVRFTGELETEDALGVTSVAKAEVESLISDGITVSEGFETRQQTEGFAQAIQAIAISIVAVYLVLVITFRSFVLPFTILFSLPLAIIGAAIALWLTDRVLGLPVMVGLMMLVGIVVTNAIVLMYRVQANRNKRGMNTYDALVEGGRTRLRPILMTAIAAMLALVPLALGLTEGAIIAAELATVVIGGLFSSTLLTLIVVPVMFSLLEQLTNRKAKTE
jgi:multidrug efflux pump subunit AcrB